VAIVRFSFKADAVPADAVNVRTKQYGDETCYLWDTYVGRCASDREANRYDDSDWYMTVEEPAGSGVFVEIEYASTRGWTYPSMLSRVDATPDVVERFKAHRAAQQAEREAYAAAVEASRPVKGKRVRVVAGRKVPKGSEGTVFWVGTPGRGRYGHFEQPRVGLDVPGLGRVFTAGENVRVLNDNGETLPFARYLASFGWSLDRDDKHATAK
jgi:hypothetical protein